MYFIAYITKNRLILNGYSLSIVLLTARQTSFVIALVLCTRSGLLAKQFFFSFLG